MWLGGVLFERTGSYDVIWWGSVILGVVSAIINLPIVENARWRGRRRGRLNLRARSRPWLTSRRSLIEKIDGGQTVRFADFDEKDLMDGDVTVRVEWSTINYKDGLALTGKAPVVRRWPMIPGIDFAGTVESSTHPDWKPGDKVVLNGFGLGETHLGGYAEKARVKGDWLVRLPAEISARDAMAIGTAGFTAMLAVLALERHGLTPARGPAIVTGAAGGVGSVAIALLSKLGFQVIAATGRPQEADYLKSLGAAEILDRAELAGAPKRAGQGALGLRRQLRRLEHARQSAGDDEIWRRDRRLRARGRHGSADLGRTLHPARRFAARDRFRPMPATLAPRGLAAARARPRQGQARRDHARSGVRGPDGSGPGHPGREIARPHGGARRLAGLQKPTRLRSVFR